MERNAMKFVIEIDLDKAAFFDEQSDEPDPVPEIIQILDDLTADLEAFDLPTGDDVFFLRDSNGDRVGTGFVLDDGDSRTIKG